VNGVSAATSSSDSSRGATRRAVRGNDFDFGQIEPCFQPPPRLSRFLRRAALDQDAAHEASLPPREVTRGSPTVRASSVRRVAGTLHGLAPSVGGIDPAFRRHPRTASLRTLVHEWEQRGGRHAFGSPGRGRVKQVGTAPYCGSLSRFGGATTSESLSSVLISSNPVAMADSAARHQNHVPSARPVRFSRTAAQEASRPTRALSLSAAKRRPSTLVGHEPEGMVKALCRSGKRSCPKKSLSVSVTCPSLQNGLARAPPGYHREQ